MKIFISGASGLVGSNCLEWFLNNNEEVIGSHLTFPTDQTVYFDTLSADNPNNFDIVNYNPDVIVHCGALTHVDYCEENIEESFNKTVQSTINLGLISQTINAKFVFLSTDYVFDGLNGPYTEESPTAPLNVYGNHKLEAERWIQKNIEDYLIIRVTNVYGKELRNKNFINRIIEQCKNGEKLQLKLPIDQYACPTNALDIAKCILLLCNKEAKGIYHIGSTDYMNRISLALNVLKYFPNAKYELQPTLTKELKQKALRPLKGGFISEKFNKEFPEFTFSTIQDYLTEIIINPIQNS